MTEPPIPPQREPPIPPRPPYPTSLYIAQGVIMLFGVAWLAIVDRPGWGAAAFLLFGFLVQTADVATYDGDDDGRSGPTKGTKSESTEAYFNKIGRTKPAALANPMPVGERPREAQAKEGA